MRSLMDRPVGSLSEARADGQSLEEIIGDLQSQWGVPQYPQEYKITIKVAEERDVRTAPSVAPENAPKTEGPRRERAPAAPRVTSGSAGEEGGQRQGPKKRSRRRRRRN